MAPEDNILRVNTYFQISDHILNTNGTELTFDVEATASDGVNTAHATSNGTVTVLRYGTEKPDIQMDATMEEVIDYTTLNPG